MVEMLQHDSTTLCDGAWHSLSVIKAGLDGFIAVDGGPLQRTTSSCEVCQSFFATNTNGPLYIGGIPGKWKGHHLCLLIIVSF